MPAGTYCDITKFDYDPARGSCTSPAGALAPAEALITVDAHGQIVDKTLPALDAFAIHAGARVGD
jgi:hypothetical protein